MTLPCLSFLIWRGILLQKIIFKTLILFSNYRKLYEKPTGYYGYRNIFTIIGNSRYELIFKNA